MNQNEQDNQGVDDLDKLKNLERELDSINKEIIDTKPAVSSQVPVSKNQPQTQVSQKAFINKRNFKQAQQTSSQVTKKTQLKNIKNPQSKILRISLIVLFTTIFVTGLFSLKDALFNKNGKRDPTTTPFPTQLPTDITEGWLDYKDSEFFYEIKYPLSWVISVLEGDSLGNAEFSGLNAKGEGVKLVVGKYEEKLERSETLEEFDKRITVVATPSALKRTKEVIEGKLNVYKKTVIIKEENGWKNRIQYVFSDKDGVYFAYAFTNTPDEDEPFFDKMVSTFRFAEVQKIICPKQKPEACTEECVVPPPYICGSDGKSYCTTCKACSESEVEFYTIQYEKCVPQD